jgi:hypothetical protein
VSCAVALATCRDLPELDPDDRPLAAALRARGLEVEVALWDDPDYDWGGARIVLLRSTWDYFRRLPDFLAWAERVARATTLLNPLEAVRWNLDKRYLVELAGRGAPVVPTLLLERGARVDLAALLAERGWRDFVLKPAVSADSWETYRLDADRLEEASAHLARLLPERDLLVQPFLAAVESNGERCLVFLDGRFSHAVRKNPLTRGGRWAGLPEGVPVEAERDELDAAARVLAACPFDALLYARVDLVRGAGGEPLLLELELAEPTLFLADAPAGLERLVAALLRRLAGAVPESAR